MVKKGGTLPRYDWDDKRDICYKLYVEEKKSVAQCVEYFADLFKVDVTQLPSKKVFHRQFTEKWGFPKRRTPIDEAVEQQIAATMREMWSRNCQLKDIHQALLDEGHELNQYDFNKIRRKYRLNRRGDTGYAPLNGGAGSKRRAQDQGQRTASTEADEAQFQSEQALQYGLANAMPGQYMPPPSMSTGVAMDENQNAQTTDTAQFPNPEQPQQYPKVLGSKRRKRARGLGDEADPDAPPSYGSETSLDECKAFLSLDNPMYQDLRGEYDAICRDMNVDRKKSSLADGRWQESKNRLVRGSTHLSAVMNPLQPNLKQKELALDLICADVTKRLRDSRKSISVSGANNLLGLDPAASKELRRLFYDILEEDKYTSRDACGDEHWKELQQKWYDSSPLLSQVMRDQDPQLVKSVKVLGRDASKRYNDDKARKDPARKQYTRQYYGPGPGAATHRAKSAKNKDVTPTTPSQGRTQSPQQARQTQVPTPTPTRVQRQQQPMAQLQDFDAAVFQQSLDPALMSTPVQSVQPVQSASAIPAYFRLDPSSNIVGHHPRMWLGRLEYPSIMSLSAVATSKAGPARIRHVHGIIVNADKTEDSYRIDSDDELSVYLEAAGSKATFAVALDGGYA